MRFVHSFGIRVHERREVATKGKEETEEEFVREEKLRLKERRQPEKSL